jgi:hypothetical protein
MRGCNNPSILPGQLLMPILSLWSILFLVSGCRFEQAGEKVTPENWVGFEPTARAFEFEDSRAACQNTSECVLMRVGGCSGVQAIHLSQVNLANTYTAFTKDEQTNVVCAPQLPIEEYEPLCLNQHCRAVIRAFRLLLEVPDQPVAGEPFWIGMSFRFTEDADRVEAKFNLPESFQVVEGQTIWSGPLKAGTEQVLWVQVQTNTTGRVYLSGWAKITDGNQAISPLTWSEYVTVAVDPPLTPPLERERILSTPTP